MTEFQKYVVNAPSLHLGQTGVTLKKGQEIESDGQSLVKVNGKEVEVPAFKGAIAANWVVLADGPQAEISARKPLTISKADGSGDKVQVKVVPEEENTSRPISSVMKDNPESSEDDSKVVAKIKSPAKSERVEIGVNDRKVVKDIENSKPKVERVAKATGDVEETQVGDTLEEVLKGASVAGKLEEDTSAKDQKETLTEAQIRKAKSEVLKLVYPEVAYKYDNAWRNRAKVVVEYFNSSQDQTMLKAFKSIEIPSVVKEIERRTK